MRVLITLMSILALIATPPAQSAPVVALQDDQLPNFAGADLDRRLDALAATGAKVTRLDVLWSAVAPTRPRAPKDPDDPAYDWSRYDAILRGLASRGISAIVDYYRTPPWASASGAANAAPRPAEGAAFAGALARRYDGQHRDAAGVALPEVRRIEVWNEPNIGFFWSPQCRTHRGRNVLDGARRYAALLTLAYREVKRANPRAIVVGGVAGPASSTSGCGAGEASVGTLDFMDVLAREKVPMDAWSQHIYPIGSPFQAYFFPSWSQTPQLLRAVDRITRGAPVYVTETGYHTSYNRFHRYFVTEGQQAAWLDQTFRVASRYPRVEVAVWFNLQDNPFWTGGLMRADGSHKPAYERFGRWAAETPVPEGWRP